MSILTLIISVVFWNWLGGLGLGVVFGLFVIPFFKRAKNFPEDERAARAYFRAVATNHLINHFATSLITAAFCWYAASTETSPWMAWTVFGLFFVFGRLQHIIDAGHKLITGEGMPAASDG